MKYEQTQQAILRGLQDGNEITEDEYGRISGALSGVESDLRTKPPQKGNGPVDNQTIETTGRHREVGEETGRDPLQTSGAVAPAYTVTPGGGVEFSIPAEQSPVTPLATPAVYDPAQGYEVQQVGGWGRGIGKSLEKLFGKPDIPPGRTEAPEQARPAYGDPTGPSMREVIPEDKPITIDPDTQTFLNRMDKEVATVDLYGKHGRTNFGTIASTDQFNDDFREFLLKAMEIEDTVPEKVTFDEIILKAEQLHWGRQDVMNLDPKAWDNSAPMLKVKDIWLQAAAYAHKVTKLAADGDPEAGTKLGLALKNLAIVEKQKNALQASIARTLTAQRIKRGDVSTTLGIDKIVEVEDIEHFANVTLKETTEIPPGLTPQQFAKALLFYGDDAPPEALAKLAEEMPGGWQEVFFAHMYPFMLSSFRTHAANWLSNGSVLANYLGTQGFAAMASPIRRKVLSRIPGLHRIFKDSADQKTAKEFLHNLLVVKQLFGEAWRVGRKAYGMEPERIKMGKLERKKMPSEIVNAKSMQEMFQNLHDPKNPHTKDKWLQKIVTPKDLKQGGTLARAFDWWGKQLDWPGKALHGADEYAKTFSRALGELGYAYKKAGQFVEQGIITPGEHDAVVQQLLRGRSPKMQAAGETLAEFNTFQNELGKIGKWIQEGREHFNWGLPWGHMVLAFVKTPINVQKYNFHLMNMTGKTRNDIMGKNGGAAQDEALGRWAVASVYVTSAMGLANKFFSENVWLNGYGSMGVEIGAEGRESKRARKMVEMNAGFKPCSLAIRDNEGTVHTYGFNTLDPLSTYFCATADISQNWHDIVGSEGEFEAGKFAASLYEIFANNLVNKNFAKNAHEFMALLFDPNQALRSPRVVDNMVSIIIPRIIKDMKTSLLLDDRYREFEHAMDGFSGMWDVTKNNIPGLSQTLGPKVNYWNEPIYNLGSWGPDWLSPFRYSRTKPDAVDLEMYRLLMPMRDLPRTLDGVKMHPRVRLHWYYVMNNYEGGGDGLKMKQRVERMISPKNSRYHDDITNRYPGDPQRADEDRIELIKKILRDYKLEAKKQLLIANKDPIVMKYQPDLWERIQARKNRDKETKHQLDKDKMQVRDKRGWKDYYDTMQEKSPIPIPGFN